MSLDDVISKVQKLRRLAQSDNPNEAATAAALADRLIQAHGLAESQLQADGTATPRETASEDASPVASWTGNVVQWHLRLAVGLISHYQCAAYFSHSRRSDGTRAKDLRIIGCPSDVASVRYMCTWLTGEIDRLANRHAMGGGKTYANNYRQGCVAGVLDAMRNERHAMQSQARENGQSAALAIYDSRAQASRDALAKSQPSLAKGKPIAGARSSEGFSEGRQAGGNIHRGASIGQGNGTRALGA